MLTQKKLRELLSYDPLTGIFLWKISRGRMKVGDVAGSKNRQDYRRIKINGKLYFAHRLAWLYVYGYFPENEIDHIDRMKHHNWIKNLREVSRQCNMRNSGTPVVNKSGIKGVYWNKRDNKWQAQIRINRKPKNLGCSSDFAEAVCIRLAAEQCLEWATCDDNSPAFQFAKTNIQKLTKEK